MFDYSSLFGIKLDMDKKARILTRESGSAHAMSLRAVDTDENDKPLKWQFENSWGSSAGHNGFMTFTDKWFDEYLFRIVINKKYLDEKSLKAAKQKPVALPAWDYMCKLPVNHVFSATSSTCIFVPKNEAYDDTRRSCRNYYVLQGTQSNL